MTLRNDATRLRIVTKDARRARAVVARQGQVLLDTDLDQQARLLVDRIEIETVDTLGSPGRLLVPVGSDAFKVTPAGAADLNLGAGHGYLDGWLLENAAPCKLSTQPHPRTGDSLAAPAIVAVKSLVRYVDPVEEPELADVALGDAQASGRALADWQAFPITVSGGGPVTCATTLTSQAWLDVAAPSTGTLTVIEPSAPPSTDPCSLTPGGGYTRLENLLYRLEVHGGVVNNALPSVDGPRFKLDGLKLKLSRRNASVMVRVVTVAGAEITVAPAALDPRNWFAPGLFAEIVSIHDDVDPRAALAHERLFRVALATDDRITLQATAAQVAATGATGDGTWFLRLWDAYTDGQSLALVSAPGASASSNEIDFGDGLHGKLGKGATGTFRRGDYWTFAARADGSVGWPKTGGVPDAMTPHGPEIRYAPLAVISANPAAIEDCRVPFGTLSDQLLLYRGGDGQAVFPAAGVAMVDVPAKLRVAVILGETPVAGARVRWSFVGPANRSCRLDTTLCDAANPFETTTDADGLAEVQWAIDSGSLIEKHQVEAALVSGGVAGKPPIVFTATFSVAEKVGYVPPDGVCTDFANIDNVDAALDVLVKEACKPDAAGGASCCHTVGRAGKEDGEFASIIEAIKALRERGHRHICLCLLPGEYALEPGELESVLDDILGLEIGGLGATLTLERRLEFTRLQRVELHDITIVTKDSEALAFQAKEPMDVELRSLTVTAFGESTRALIEFFDCRRVHVLASQLTAGGPGKPGLRDVLPGRLGGLVEMVDTMEAARARAELARLVELPEGSRRAIVRDFERAMATHSAKLDADVLAMLETSVEPIRSGSMPTTARFAKIFAMWKDLAGLFARDRSWPIAIAFTHIAVDGSEGTDAVITDCRLSGGVIVGGPDRDTDGELKLDEILMDGHEGRVPDGFGSLRLDGNVLGWLAIGREQVERILGAGNLEEGLQGLLFGESFLTRNTFTTAPHLHVANAATMHGNRFEQSSRMRVGLVSAEVVSATGNLGPPMVEGNLAQLLLRGDPGAKNEAGNARLQVI